MSQTSLFPDAPKGFIYGTGLFSAADETRFAGLFATLPLKPFEFHGHLGHRRIVSYGWRYDYSGARLREAEPIPDFLESLRDVAARFSAIPAPDFQHALVTEYAPGAGIGWHRDKPMFEDVVALSFLAPCRLRFRRRHGAGWERVVADVAPRSGYLLRGPARDEWEHSIPPLDRLRYSVTFRNFRR